MKFIGLGHSHIVALANGSYELEAEGYCLDEMPVTGRFHYLYDNDYLPALMEIGGRQKLNPKIENLLHLDDFDFILLCLGGNEHNILAIGETLPEYDFLPRREKQGSIHPDAFFIPESVICETLRGWFEENIAILSHLKSLTRRPIITIAPPPPLPRERILEFPKEFFKSIFDIRKLNSDRIRRKMWLSQISLIEDICNEHEIHFIDVPDSVCDRNGMLAHNFWGNDASHGNVLYGRQMMLRVLDYADRLTACRS